MDLLWLRYIFSHHCGPQITSKLLSCPEPSEGFVIFPLPSLDTPSLAPKMTTFANPIGVPRIQMKQLLDGDFAQVEFSGPLISPAPARAITRPFVRFLKLELQGMPETKVPNENSVSSPSYKQQKPTFEESYSQLLDHYSEFECDLSDSELDDVAVGFPYKDWKGVWSFACEYVRSMQKLVTELMEGTGRYGSVRHTT